MNKKERTLLLKTEFDCVKGDDVYFKVDKNVYRGIVVDLVPKHEHPSKYFTEEVPDSRDKSYMWEDDNGSLTSVLFRVMTGKKNNLVTYYSSREITRKVEKVKV